MSKAKHGLGLGAHSFVTLAGTLVALSVLLAVTACGSTGSDPTAGNAPETGGASSQSPSSEPGTPTAETSVREPTPLDAATRAFIASQQAKPRPDTRILDAHAEQVRKVASTGSPLAFGASNKVLDLAVPPSPTTYPLSATTPVHVPIVSSSASSSYDGRWPTTASYDGDLSTLWMTAGNAPTEGKDYMPWIQYTFDQVYSLGTMRVVNFDGYEYLRGAKDVEVLVSQDGTTFTSLGYKRFLLGSSTTIDGTPITTGATWQSFDFGGASAKYVRLAIHTNYYGGVFYGSPAPEVPFANASITGLREVQFYADLPVPPPSLTKYPLSADGKYYTVNLLNRNFLPPTANATFSSGVGQLGYAAPPLVFDGGDAAFTAIAATPGDPNVTVTLTVDMGQYFSIGAVRPMYQVLGGPESRPVSQRVRLATKLGPQADWQTVVNAPTVSNDSTLSFDATPARFLELTMYGNGGNLLELFVYPSAQTSPPPTYAGGYDVTSLASTQSVNENFFPLGEQWPVSWPAGGFRPKNSAWGPTGDAVATVDLGAQYPISRVATSFFWSTPWANGGRLEMGATPDAYTILRDSGPGHDFGWPLNWNFATQPVRYLRATDYFIPGSGLSDPALWSLHAYATPPPHVGYFPLSADGKYFVVNLVRRPVGDVQPTASVVYSNGALAAPLQQDYDADHLVDGDDTDFAFVSPAANMPDATATLTVDLGQVQKLGAVRPIFAYAPVSSSIRIAPTLNGPWKTVLSGPVTTTDVTTSFDGFDAQYVELTMKGTTANFNFANTYELMVYPSSETDPAPSSGSHLDFSYLTGMSVSTNANMGQSGSPRLHSFDGVGGLYVKTTAQGATGDATATIDLGQLFQVSQLDLAFFNNQVWPDGARVDLDDGTDNWFNVLDTGRGTQFGSSDGGLQRIAFAAHPARYVRLTGYVDANLTATGLIENMAVFGQSAPCTPSCGGRTCGDDGCGGLCGGACAGSGCSASSDCQSGLVCTGFSPGGTVATLCQPPGYPGTCTNGARDGNETDVDCGGSCGQCASGHTCVADVDCGTTLVCGQNNGAYFGQARAKNLCWAATCQLGPDVGGCGNATSPCGQNCAGVTVCDATSTTNTCGTGETCSRGLGQLFGAESSDVCADSRCPSNDPTLCGASDSLCGSRCICTPSCGAATCQNPSDGCGGICPGVCHNGDTGCPDDIACGPGLTCLAGSDGMSSCHPQSCAFKVMTPELCGYPGAECGDLCPACTPSCDGRQCGPDPKCGTSCGSCGDGTSCNGVGRCVAPTVARSLNIPDGNGGLKALPPLSEPETVPVGALKGNFSVADQGSPVYNIPIDVPPGRAGMEPALSLQYSGSRSNGEVGVGWHLEGLSKITRCPRTFALDGVTGPVRNDSKDRFCIDGKRMESVPPGVYGANGTEYRTLIDSFAKIVSNIDSVAGLQIDPLGHTVAVPPGEQGPDTFVAWTKDGRKLTYGGTYDATVLAHTGVRYAWLLNRVEDRAGNVMLVEYSNLALAAPESQTVAPNSVVLPRVIIYTGHTWREVPGGGDLGTGETPDIIGSREVRFKYEARTDPQLRFTQGGAPFVAAQRLSRITTLVDQKPVKNYHLQYAAGDLSQVEKIFECAGGDDALCKPPTTFEYSHTGGFQSDRVGVNLAAAGQLDINGDGLPDFMATNELVGGVPAQPTLKALQVSSDIAVSAGALVLDAYVGPEAGFALSVTWDIIKVPFWGSLAKEPTITFQHSLQIATGKNGYNTFQPIENVQGIRCEGDHPAFMLDYDQDGRDDVLSACGTNNGNLYVARSVGDGKFEALPKDNSPVATVVIGQEARPDGSRTVSGGTLAGPILIDVDGDGLQDIVSCPDQYTVEVRRRRPPPDGFADAIKLPTDIPIDPDGPSGHGVAPPRDLQILCGHHLPTYNSLDVDGDGTPDLLVGGKDSWHVLRFTPGGQTALSWQSVPLPNTAYSADAKTLNVGDFNGDGLADVFGYDDSTYTVWLNTGGGRFYSRPIARPKPVLDWSSAQFRFSRVAVLDYNTDGRDDFLEHWQTPNYDAGLGIYTWDSFNWALKPNGKLDAFTTDTVPSIQWLGEGGRPQPGDFTMAADVNGDGHTDLFGSDSAVYYGNADISLTRITDGLGKTVDISYGSYLHGGSGYKTDARCAGGNLPGSAWPEKCLPRMNGVVAGYTEGTVDPSGTRVPERFHGYTFVNGRMNLTGHGWLGFDQMVVTDSSAAPGDGGTTTTIDYEPVARYKPTGELTTGTQAPYLYPFAGLARITTVDHGVASAIVSQPPLQNGFYERRIQTINHWQVQQSAFNRPFPVVRSRETTTYDRPVAGGIGAPPPFDYNGMLLLTCSEDLTTDSYGNLHDDNGNCEEESGDGSPEEFRTLSTFTPDPSTWLISNPTNVQVFNSVFDGSGEREYELTYTGGLLDTVTRAPAETNDRWHHTTYVRDDFGNVKQIIEEARVGSPRTTNITYDDEWVFPATVTNAAGQMTQVSYDRHWGVLEEMVDPYGVALQFSFDGFGRLKVRKGPDGTSLSTYSNIAGPNRVTAVGAIDPKIQVKTETVGSDGSSDGVTLTELDGYGRPVRSTSDGFAGAKVIQERVYDQLGRVIGSTKPHTADLTTVPFDRFSYEDNLKRLTRIDHSDGSFKQYQYASWASLASSGLPWLGDLPCAGSTSVKCAIGITRTIDTRTIDEESRENVVITDHGGKVIRNIDGENITDAAHSSNYEYGAFGRMFKAHDNRNLVTKFNYDDYGRLLSKVDPDTGPSIYTYDGFDELRTSKDPKLQVRTYNRDSLGRLESIVDPDGLSQWIYEPLGRLSATISPATAENPSGQQINYSYEPATATRNRGLLQDVTYTIDGTPYSISVDYDGLGRTKRIHYPTNGTGQPIVAQYNYDDSGVLTGLDEVGSGGTGRPLWRVNDVYQGHLIQNETLGDGASATRTAYRYDPARRWLDSVHTTIDTTLGTEQIQALDYGHYSNGLVHTLNAQGADPREYVYDNLNRLAFENITPAQGQPVSIPYTYDEIGNIVGNGAVINTYLPAQPHLLNTVGYTSYGYDENGNVSSRSGPGIPGYIQTFDYTAFDLPRTIHNPNSSGVVADRSFDYSADEERLVRRDVATGITRHFAAGLYERQFDAYGTTQEEHFRLYAGDRQIAEITRKDNAEQTLFFHPDHLGSPETISDDSGASYHERFEPFGAPIDAPNPELSRVGFTGQDHDNDLGLIDMKGRIYDPLAGRFLTPDPVTQAPFWSQGLNRYSYVFNNPINNTDPSGFDAEGESGGDLFGAFIFSGHADGVALAIAGSGISGGALAAGLGIGALNPATSLLTGQYNLFNGSDPYTRSGTAPTTAPKGTGYNRLGGAGATGDNKGGPPELARPPSACDVGMCLAQSTPAGEGAPGYSIRTDGTGGGVPVAQTSEVLDAMISFLGQEISGAINIIISLEEHRQTFLNDAAPYRASANQMNKEVKRGQAPREVKRVDNAHPPEDPQAHAHLENGTRVRRDGTTNPEGASIPQSVVKWLRGHGWNF